MAARMLLVLDPTGNEITAFKIVRKKPGFRGNHNKFLFILIFNDNY